ncbi:MAG: hypothetical protein GXP24_02650 [Planctomycetes bacterium]|nr:hypothetical protein [Planctomycetota bacterium]
MNSTTIDPLFQITTSQITTPARSGRGSSQSGSADKELFRALLDRAADAVEPKLPTTKRSSETVQSKEDEPRELQAGEQEASTTEQEPTTTPESLAESSETSAEATEEPPEEPTDEVTLSAAALAPQAEANAASEQVVNAEGVVETSLTDGQQQSSDQSPTSLDEAPSETAASSTGIESAALESDLLGEGVVGETASDVGEVSVEAEVESGDTKASLNPGTSQATTATAVEGEAKKAQSSTTSTSVSKNPQQPAGQHSSNALSESLPEADAAESSPQTDKGRFEVPASTTTTAASNELAVATDAELALANLNNASESTANSHNSSAPSTAETVAAAGRTLGNSLAGKAANAASTAAETSNTETPTVDRARFVQRVGGAIRSAQNRDGQIQLRLSPPELGTLRINIVMNEGVLTARLETETAAARAVLLDNLPALRERLAEQEIRIEKFDVDVGREGQQQAENPDAEDRQTRRARSSHNQPSRREQAPSLATESNSVQPVTASGLDVRI